MKSDRETGSKQAFERSYQCLIWSRKLVVSIPPSQDLVEPTAILSAGKLELVMKINFLPKTLLTLS